MSKNPCPADGCDGEWELDIGGSAAAPEKEYVTTCGHTIEQCAVCSEMHLRDDLNVYSWHNPREMNFAGKDHRQYFCDGCDDEADEYIPERAVPGEQPNMEMYNEQ